MRFNIFTCSRYDIFTTFSSWNLWGYPVNKAAFLALYVTKHGTPLKNKKTRSFAFGSFRDEVKIAMYDNIPIVYFAGSDTQLNNDTYLEWKSNYNLYTQRDAARLNQFVQDVYDSLPNTHKTQKVVLVGYSRGGFTMSAYASFKASCAAIFIACPGDLFDCRKTSSAVYSFGHAYDPVYMLSAKEPLRVHVRRVFWDKKGMAGKELAATVHGNFGLWLKDVASNKNIDTFCE
jgi:pimeloyl-ACP methyl ester carboxylesterase